MAPISSSPSASYSPYISSLITFTAGASYGLTTVVVGQPFDTIKTRMQGLVSTGSPSFSAASAGSVFRDLYAHEGIRGLYRGGVPLLLGGSFMRSAQFGVSAEARDLLQRNNVPSYKFFHTLDSTVLIAGIAGGMGRAFVEIPTDFFKIRRQVQINPDSKLSWKIIKSNIADGGVVTMARNTLLFTSFVVYIDFSKQACEAGLVPQLLCTKDGTALTPFAKGAICANMAWITVWPIDVVKTQRQSGNYGSEAGAINLLMENIKTGKMFRGLVPGLIRSSIANGSSMVVYEFVHSSLTQYSGVDKKDMT